MNFNFSSQPEYSLNTQLTEEMIRLYGILTKFLVTEKINYDSTVFGDYSHLKSDSNQIYDIYMLPENTEDWDNSSYAISQYGLMDIENVSLFAPKSAFIDTNRDEIHEIIGNLLVFPNNKIMEISDVDIVTPGINNLYTFPDEKSVYKITCKPHSMKLFNELDTQDISTTPGVPNESLDVYFQELITQKNTLDTEAELVANVPSVDKSGLVDVQVQKPIVDKSEDSVFGEF